MRLECSLAPTIHNLSDYVELSTEAVLYTV